MTFSRETSSDSSANSDLTTRHSSLYSMAGKGGDQSRGIGSMNMDQLLNNVYADGSASSEVASCGGGGWGEEEVDLKLGVCGLDGLAGGGGEMMNLEEYLARMGMMPPEMPVEGSMLESLVESILGDPCGYWQLMQQQQQGQLQPHQRQQSDVSFLGVEGGEVGGRGKRKAVEEPVDKATLQRQRRMIKNRESAARSRERKQSYIEDLEFLVIHLKEENLRLRSLQEDRQRKRVKQLMETLIPVVESKRPPRRLRRTLSMEW